MRRIIMCAVVIGFATVAYANDGDVKDKPEDNPVFSLGICGMVYGTSYNTVQKDRSGSYSAVRMEPVFSLTKGDIEAVFKLRYDGTYGADKDNDDETSDAVGLGSDKIGLRVKNAYFSGKIASLPGISLIAGIAHYDYPLVWCDDAPLASIRYGKDTFSISVWYVKIQEGGLTRKDDSQMGIADASFKFGDITIRPAIFFTSTDPKSDSTIEGTKEPDSKTYQPSITVNATFDKIGFDATGSYVTGKTGGTSRKYRAYAADIAPGYKISDTIKVIGFFTLVSGDSSPGSGDENSFLKSTVDGEVSGINSWRLFIIEDGGSFTYNSDVCDAGKYTNSSGYYAAGLAFEGSFGNFTAKVQGAWIRAAKTAPARKKDIGIEIDANVGYAIATGATLYVEGAFLKTGKFYDSVGEKQNAAYANIGMKCEL